MNMHWTACYLARISVFHNYNIEMQAVCCIRISGLLMPNWVTVIPATEHIHSASRVTWPGWTNRFSIIATDPSQRESFESAILSVSVCLYVCTNRVFCEHGKRWNFGVPWKNIGMTFERHQVWQFWPPTSSFPIIGEESALTASNAI